MSSRSRTLTKLATLEAARTIYFVVVALAVREVLSRPFTETDFNTSLSDLAYSGYWLEFSGIVLIELGYLFSIIRFSHGISTLIGHERERIEKTNLPSAGRISSVSLLIVLMSIFLYLMSKFVPLGMNASFKFYFRWFLILGILMSASHLVLIFSSKIIRLPAGDLFKALMGVTETVEGYQSNTAYHWIRGDARLVIVCLILLFINEFDVIFALWGLGPFFPVFDTQKIRPYCFVASGLILF